ncbi:MAG: SurA N-terminal domain-containing protein, partial [bacterium]|nr:SurA N-terminal domain-containing protein [bacterium]
MSFRINGILFVIVFCLLFSGPAAGQMVTVERIIAKINQDIITLSELQDLVKKEGNKFLRSLKEKDAERRRRELELLALDQLIEQKLIVQRAKELDAKVDDKDLEKAIDTIIARNNLTKESFGRYLQLQGISFETFRDRMRQRLLVRQIVGLEVDARISVNESEVKSYYDSNITEFQKGASRKVRQIFFPIGQEDTEARKLEKKKKADDAYTEVSRVGADFAKLAKSLSEGPAAQQGGDLGYLKKGEVFPEFEAAVF